MLSQCNGITHFAISLRENVSPQLFLRVNDIPPCFVAPFVDACRFQRSGSSYKLYNIASVLYKIYLD